MAPPDHVAHVLLQEAHPTEDAAAIFKDKILHKPLYLRATSPNSNSHDARAQRRLRRIREKERAGRGKKIKPLSAKEKRRTGIYDVCGDTKRYEIYEALHNMWLGYMQEILGLSEQPDLSVNMQNAGSKLASADYHGAHVTVVRSRCAGMVGLKGIVIKDSKFTFQVITRQNQLKIIPKKYTIFQLEIPRSTRVAGKLDNPNKMDPSLKSTPIILELHGSQFEHRAADRATKKFRQRSLDDL